MKIILKGEVDNLGLAGDVVDVADGYGRNYLIPRGLAILATKGAMKEAEALTRSRKVAESKTLGDAEAARETLESRTLRIPARVDERGNLYGSVSAVDVQRVLKERGHDLERKRIDLKGTIKAIGEYEVPVRVHPQVTATVVVEVVDEEGKVVIGQAPPEHAPLPGEEARPTRPRRSPPRRSRLPPSSRARARGPGGRRRGGRPGCGDRGAHRRGHHAGGRAGRAGRDRHHRRALSHTTHGPSGPSPRR
jgi:large subunit ribosomal protein L9